MKFEMQGGGPADGLAWDSADKASRPSGVLAVKGSGTLRSPAHFDITMGGKVRDDETSPEYKPVARYVFHHSTDAGVAIYWYTPLAAAVL